LADAFPGCGVMHQLQVGPFYHGIGTTRMLDPECYPNPAHLGQYSSDNLQATYPSQSNDFDDEPGDSTVPADTTPAVSTVACLTTLPTWSLRDTSISPFATPVVQPVSCVVLAIHQLERATTGDPGPHCAHMDDGAMMSTTDQRHLLWHFSKRIPFPTKLVTADRTPHSPTGFGYLCLRSTAAEGVTMVPTLYTPSMAVTIVSPGNICHVVGGERYQLDASLDGQEVVARIYSTWIEIYKSTS